jgi:glycosyltransferase involved in cell wall biosynthesis
MTNCDISVIICTYNRVDYLSKVLEDLEIQTAIRKDISFELVLVDNNSTDKTKEVVEDYKKKGNISIQYLFEPKQGKTFALNTGVRAAKGNIIAFTDDDVRIDPSWLWELKKVFDEYDCAGVGGRIVATWTFEKPEWVQSEGPYRLMDVIIQFDQGDKCCELQSMPYGANMAYKRVMFEKYGLFRLDLGPRPGSKIYYEDTEFALRVKNGKEKLMYAPDAVVYHPVEKSRINKKYFQSWYFGYGGALVRTNGFPNGSVLYFGVPRYMFKSLAIIVFKWIFTNDERMRFVNNLKVYLEAGKIAEAYRLKRSIK